MNPSRMRKIIFNLKMSDKLRRICNINSGNEAVSTILFISGNKVEAYTMIQRNEADFATRDTEKKHLFPFDQKFIMDKEREVYIYNE